MTDKAQSGDDLRITAAGWNKSIDAGDYYERVKRLGEGVTSQPFSIAPIKVRNNTGADRRAGEVVGIGSLLLDELTNNYMWFGSSSPTECEPFGVYIHATPNGKIGSVSVAGACKALVDINDECHRFANVADGEYVLQSDDTGPVRIIYAPAGTGEKTCLVAFSWDLPDCPACDNEGDEECRVTAKSFGLDRVANYNANAKQALAHAYGCLLWMDIDPCETDGTSPPETAGGTCVYQWSEDSEEWYLISDGCDEGYSCDGAPVEDGTYDGQTSEVDCSED